VTVDAATLRTAPKALLHDHLDGGLRPTTILELADECGWTPNLPATDPVELQAWFTRGAETGDILRYLATFEHTLAVLQTAEALERVAAEAVADLAADGVVYAELRFAPELHESLPLEAAVEAVCAGLRRGETEAGGAISAYLICCAMRTGTRSLEIAELVDRMRDVEPKVVGYDLAGAETGFPPSLHAEALSLARRRHLNVTLHASEPPDLELIDDAIVHGAHRIGHGVRLRRDTSPDPDAPGGLRLGPLARHVLDRQIHLEMAPTCHVQVGAVPSLTEHPLGPFLRAGFSVGVNTDNRLMSAVSPASELAAVVKAFDLAVGEVECLVVNAIQAGFAPYEERKRILDHVVRPWYVSLASPEGAKSGRST
jgi:adenosine deaminase